MVGLKAPTAERQAVPRKGAEAAAQRRAAQYGQLLPDVGAQERGLVSLLLTVDGGMKAARIDRELAPLKRLDPRRGAFT